MNMIDADSVRAHIDVLYPNVQLSWISARWVGAFERLKTLGTLKVRHFSQALNQLTLVRIRPVGFSCTTSPN